MRKFKALMGFILMVSVLLIGTVMAIPTLTVTVQKAAMGEGTINPPAQNASVNLIPTADGQSLDSVDVKFDQDLEAGAVVYAYAYDSNGTLLDSGSTTLQANVAAGNPINVDMPNDPALIDVAKIQVIVFGPQL